MELCDQALPTPMPSSRTLGAVACDRLSDRLLAWVDAHRGALLAGVLALYLLGFNAQWRVERDSALYLSIGRNLAEGHGYSYHGMPHDLAFPGLPYLFAGTFRLFRTQSLVPALVLMLLMGLATLALVYRLFLIHSGRPTAVLMTVGVGLTRLFYRYNFELLSDLPFLLGVMAFLTGYEAIFFGHGGRQPGDCALTGRWYDWALLAGGLGLAVLMRPVMYVLVAAIVLALLWRALRGPGTWAFLGLAGAVILCAVAFHLFRNHSANGADEYEGYVLRQFTHLGPLLHQVLHVNLHDLFEATLIKALFGCPILRVFNTLIGLMVIALCIMLLRERVLWGLWALLTVGMLLLTKPLDRYMLPVIPLLVFGWWRLLASLNHRLPERWADLVFLGLLIGGIGTNVARVGEMVVEQRRVPFLAHYHDGRYESALRVAAMVRNHTPKDKPDRRVWILTAPRVARVMTFLSRRNAFETTESISFNPATDRLYALVGPSWDDSREKKASHDDPMRSWLALHGMQLDHRAIARCRPGRKEREAWALYAAKPAG